MNETGRVTISSKSESVMINGVWKIKVTVECPYCGKSFTACFKKASVSYQSALDDYNEHAEKDCKPVRHL